MPTQGSDVDPFLWLEGVEDPKALDWVREHNKPTLEHLQQNPMYKTFEKEIREIVLAKDRVPFAGHRAGWMYDFWQDETNVRGVWRRTTFEDYKNKDPKWDVLLDVDTLAKKENENWVYKGVTCLYPDYEKCLVSLSRGGKDAVVIREFDLRTKAFEENGFFIKEAKTMSYKWLDKDTIFLATDFGEGSMTDSGYPRVVKKWKRHTPIESAETIFTGEKTDISVSISVDFETKPPFILIHRSSGFFEGEDFYLDPKNSKLKKIPFPSTAQYLGISKHQLFALLREDWQAHGKVFTSGSLVAISVDAIGKEDPIPELVFTSPEHGSISSFDISKNAYYISTLENVTGRIYQITRQENGIWKKDKITGLPDHGEVSISTSPFEELVFLYYTDFITPYSMYYKKDLGGLSERTLLKQSPARFDAKDMVVEQKFAKSKDGISVPYFIMHKKNIPLNGLNPTILYGYGGFEISLTPSYLSTWGKAWLERGGVGVYANIRGGGEFGPGWHKAALKENRQKAYDDFIAVAEDLERNKISSPKHLAIMGGSNGGLLVGAVAIQRPELYKAVVCQVPLLDMLRYHKLLAGASWIDEYGNPENPEMEQVIRKYSPYQNLVKGKKYPTFFFITSTKDDRVHPAHARKMAAKMESFDIPFEYFENIDGGHGASANLEEYITRSALEFTFLWRELNYVQGI